MKYTLVYWVLLGFHGLHWPSFVFVALPSGSRARFQTPLTRFGGGDSLLVDWMLPINLGCREALSSFRTEASCFFSYRWHHRFIGRWRIGNFLFWMRIFFASHFIFQRLESNARAPHICQKSFIIRFNQSGCTLRLIPKQFLNWIQERGR